MNKFLLYSLTVAGLALNATAAPILISNPSFENPAQGASGFSFTVNGWNVTGTAGVFQSTSYFASIPGGNQTLAVSYNSAGDVSQSLAAVLAANTTYTLTYYVGQRTDVAFNSNYAVSVLANNVVLASDTGANPAAGQFVQRTLSFTTGANPSQLGQNLVIDISAASNGATQANFDLITLDATTVGNATPEPGSLALTVAGLTGLWGFARRRTQNQAAR